MTQTFKSVRSFPYADNILSPRMLAAKTIPGMIRPDYRSLGILTGIAGGSQPLGGRGRGGFNTAADVVTQTADGRDLNQMWAELQQVAEAQNAARDALVRFLTFPVSNPVEEVPQMSGSDFEEATEFGVPRAIRPEGDYFSMAFGFQWYDLAGRFTWQYLADATAAQIQSVTNAALEADNRLIFNQVLRTVFNPTNLSASIRRQPYTVYKFYNGDGTVPPSYKTNKFDSTHTHYIKSGAATVDPGDLEEQITHLGHHGYTKLNGYRVVIMVNPAEGAVIRTFRAGTNGATYDFIPALGTPGLIIPQNTQVFGQQQVANQLDGLDVIGSYGDALIVQDEYEPVGYLFAFATGGEDNLQNPIGFREHANAGLRGFRLVKGRNNDYPLIDSYWVRGFGTGIRHRGAGVVTQIGVGATYEAPVEYR